MLNAVPEGNMEAALAAQNRFFQYRLQPRVPDRLRDAKNGMLILNTNLRHCLGNAQIHPFYIDEISHNFAVQIENTNSTQKLKSLGVQMLRKYTMLVHNYSTKGYSPAVGTCMDQLRFHYAAPVSLKDLAKKCSVSPSYLSSRFKKETGMTITEYLQHIRIDHAIKLLNTENISIQQIADACGFQDSNYFIRIFKKYKGISPNQYRKQLKTQS
jgi:YesN/AraC family two-component response regulator